MTFISDEVFEKAKKSISAQGDIVATMENKSSKNEIFIMARW